jgi:hypothetical protein
MIDHNKAGCEFSYDCGDGETAVLKYRMLDKARIDFYSTFVPESARGGRVAYNLVQGGLAWAKEKNYRIQASCWYVDRFLGD